MVKQIIDNGSAIFLTKNLTLTTLEIESPGTTPTIENWVRTKNMRLAGGKLEVSGQV